MRRSLVAAGIVAVVLAVIASGITYAVKEVQIDDSQQRVATLKDQVANLKAEVTLLSYNTASGGGMNLKMMQHPTTGEPTVPMEEVFTFDRNHAMCRVETNSHAFKMQTYAMGEVVIEHHQFFMSMVATTVEQYEVSTLADGTRRVVMRGGLDCSTEVGQAEITIGSRSAAEHATYMIEAFDAGIGGGEVGDTFAFTVFFDQQDAPVNYAIFGPEFTFTGQMVEGEVSITDPPKP